MGKNFLNDKATVADLVLSFPEERANETTLIFLDHKGNEIKTFQFQELKDKCLNVAANLSVRVAPETIVLLAVEEQPEFVLSFFGAILAGAIPAPLAHFKGPRDQSGFGRMCQILEKGESSIVIVSEEQKEAIADELQKRGFGHVQLITIEELRLPNQTPYEVPHIAPDAKAYIQYTSGSTSTPKGVVLTHEAVINNMIQMYRIFDRGELVRILGWIPLYHDMGLVGHLFTALFESGQGIFIPARSLLSSPEVWIKAMSDYKANSSAAPTFSFEHCTRRVEVDPSYDLSAWKSAYVGSETVSLKILNDFAEKFAPVGFDRNTFIPVYGLAEVTLLAAGGCYGLNEVQDKIIQFSAGNNRTRYLMPYAVDRDMAVIIKDADTGKEIEQGEIGEVWIKSPANSTGYLGKLQSEPGEVPTLNTGDIGFVKDGFLYLTGRSKEVIILNGVNYAAEDLEFSAKYDQDHLQSNDHTICVSDIDDSGEKLFVFQEVQRHKNNDDFEAIASRIQANLLESHSLSPDQIVLIPRGFLPRTRNYKLARKECLQRFLDGSLRVVFSRGAEKPATKDKVADKDDPVVVVGMACRFPGADNIDEFWDLLANGVDAISEVPDDRWNNDDFYDSRPAVPGKVNTRWAGFLEEIDQFDPALFGVSTYEAPELDPQQRLLLETSWRLIEHTGWKKDALKGTDTGVFVGLSTNDYLYMKIKLFPGMESFNAYSGLGNANSVAANRLSFFYDLKGPSMAVDTACSSSLTAFHLGVKAILNGDCSQAMVGGVNAILSPGPTITLSQFGMMSPEGRCKTFDSSADGYVRSEGCGLVMLKRKSAALRDGDQILAEVAGSNVGQDGFSNGMTYPNGEAQRKLIKDCLDQYGLNPSDMSYVEAHGTGTPSGDPVEMEQIRKIYGVSSPLSCHVGSVKANIGHLEASAGVASVIKCLLMLQKKHIPPQIHVKELNPRIHIKGSRIRIAKNLTPWDTGHQKRQLSISSFGFGGSLAHLVLKEWEEIPEIRQPKSIDHTSYQKHPFVISAPSADALNLQAKNWMDWLDEEPELSIRDLSYSQAIGRSDHRYRAFFLPGSAADLKTKLSDFLNHNRKSDLYDPRDVCFLFTGQGEHYMHMAKELYQRFTVFRNAFDRCARAIDHPDNLMPLADLAFVDTDTTHWEDQYTQPILFAVQFALGTLWQEAGVVPKVLLGHSLGEYAAACLAGCFEPETGMKILKRRGELTGSLEQSGYMATIFTDHETVRKEIQGDQVQIAAINSAKKTVISGRLGEMNRLIALFEERGIETYRLKTEQAFHSKLVEPILDDFADYLRQFEFKTPDKQWISSVSGEPMMQRPDVRHWLKHMRETVLFADAVSHIDLDTTPHFVEIGPGASTLVAVKENLPGEDISLYRSLNIIKGDRTELFYFLDSLGKLYEAGKTIYWQNFLNGQFSPDYIPGQHFMKKSYWIEGLTAERLSEFSSSGTSRTSYASNGRAGSNTPDHYAVDWVEKGALPELNLQEELSKKVNWMVVGKMSDLLKTLLETLKAHNKNVFWIDLGSDQKVKGLKPESRLDPGADKAKWTKAIGKIANLRKKENVKDWKLLYLAEEPITTNDLSIAALESQVSKSVGSLIPALKALKENALVIPVWVISQQSQFVSPVDQSAAKQCLSLAPIWGFSKTMFLEHPEWRGGMIDLEKTDARNQVEALLRKVIKPSGESAVAIRGGKQYIQQITEKKPKASDRIKLRDDGAYLITGGLGGLGLECADWVLQSGGTKLLLMSRRRLPPASQWESLPEENPHYEVVQRLLKLQEKGGEIILIAQDVRDTQALRQVFDQHTIRGVLHAAGVNWFEKVMNLSEQEFLDTLKIKVSASWMLHQLSLECDLDCFVMFSSVSALWGSVNLSHYTAANHFMDVLSHYRAEAGLPTTSVQWGPWAEVGMSAKTEETELLQKLGFSLMPPRQALRAMCKAMNSGTPLSLIGNLNWDIFQTFTEFSLQPSLFGQVILDSKVINHSVEDNLKKIRSSSPEDARALIEEVVRMELKMVMLIESMGEIDAEQRFNFLGMDSLMAISFAVKLEEYFNCKLPNTLAYNYPHIKAVSDYLFELVYDPSVATLSTETENKGEVPSPQPIKTGQAESGPAAQTRNHWFKNIKKALGTPRITLFCFPYAGAGASVFSRWASMLDDHVELIAINPPGREDWADVSPFTDMSEITDALVKHFVEPENEYCFYGHSLGALTAYAFYQKLTKTDKRGPSRLLFSACHAPVGKKKGELHKLPREEFVKEVTRYFIKDEETILQFEPLIRADIQVLEQFDARDETVEIPMTVIAARQDEMIQPARVRAWVQLADDDFSFIQIDGTHDLVVTGREELLPVLMKTLGLEDQMTLDAV